MFFSWAVASQKYALYRPLAWWKSFYLDLHEKSLQSIAIKALAQLFPMVSHRDWQLFKINHVKNFVRNWGSLLQCMKKKAGRTLYHWAFPCCFCQNHTNARLKVSEHLPFPDFITTLSGTTLGRDLWKMSALFALCVHLCRHHSVDSRPISSSVFSG